MVSLSNPINLFMKKLYSLLILFSFTAYTQTIKIADAVTHQPIPYASVYLLNNTKISGGTSCDTNGNAILPVVNFDTIKITCIGYEDTQIAKTDVDTLIYLKPKVIDLEELIIGNNTHVLAYKGKKGVSLSMTKDTEFVLYVKNTFKRTLGIKTFSMKMEKAIVENTLRLVMYKATDTITHKRPGENLLQQDIIFNIKPDTEGIVEVDLTQYNIQLPADGAYIGIDVIDVKDKNGNYFLDKHHFNKFESISSYDPYYLIYTKYNTPRWGNMYILWVDALKRIGRNPKAKRNKKYFNLPAFSVEVYTN
ncbi:hypothetical protein D3C87_191540 [compost metagenome]